ncbi:MAG: 3-phosphoglycerate dehydrogenase [Xanthobacteraceae bacterium]|nr:3-phosphoglycerate dehydrogenase [Xanthobacteraceae bacterium]
MLEAVALVDDGPLDRGALLARIGNYDAVVVRFGHRIDNPVLKAGRKLRVIACAATGTDHIDVDAAMARGIKVISLRGETEFLRGISASAEHGWGLLLALMRRIPAAVDMGRSGQWNRDALRGRDLAGKQLAIIGCGRIGEKTATYARAFGMRIAAYDPYLSELPSGIERRPTIAAAVDDADVVMVHVSLTPETRNLVGASEFSAMKRGAVLVNTARGAVIDENALLSALESGQLSGAALDVLADETSEALARHPLIEWARGHENLLITPHIAGASLDAMAATEIFIAERLAAVLRVSA